MCIFQPSQNGTLIYAWENLKSKKPNLNFRCQQRSCSCHVSKPFLCLVNLLLTNYDPCLHRHMMTNILLEIISHWQFFKKYLWRILTFKNQNMLAVILLRFHNIFMSAKSDTFIRNKYVSCTFAHVFHALDKYVQ